uniref:BZIP domain-containing protein n=1 Tax=Panagrellus redivivus TaxID=6233 RepID=A0A7E4VPL9_PANRE
MAVKMETVPVPMSMNQPTTVLINQSMPTPSHIVMPPNEGDPPVYVQYVLPSDSVMVSSNSCHGNGEYLTGADELDNTVSAVSNQHTVFEPSESSSYVPNNSQIVLKFNASKDKAEKDEERKAAKKIRQAEAARKRYHRLDAEDRKALNLKRTAALKRKRQRDKEMAELEAILRQSNDIVDDPEITRQLRENRLRARWAEAARSRYHRMSEEERRAHNIRRRNRVAMVKREDSDGSGNGVLVVDEDKMKEANMRKALAARARYHRMTPEEKRAYNSKRTEAFRRRRMEEEALLSLPIGRINGEALTRAQQIVVRNAKRAELARQRYQRMTPEERRAYNAKRYTPKKIREGYSGKSGSADSDDSQSSSSGQVNLDDINFKDSYSTLEKDVMRRTEHAQQVIRQRGLTASSALSVTCIKPEYSEFPGTSSSTMRTVIKPKGPPSLANTVVVRPPVVDQKMPHSNFS